MDADAVTGPPSKMVESREDLTPMMAQYLELAEAYEDSLVLFQNGDFYQSYCEVAEEVARVCEVTLTQREDSSGRYPMAGIPVDNAASYLERLLEAGYRVAVAEQVEDAEEATGLVDRAVTQVITPGTVVDDELLDADAANYVACVVAGDGEDAGGTAGSGSAESGAADGGAGPDARDTTGASAPVDAGAPGTSTYALAAVDVSTGDCLVTSTDSWDRLVEEVERLAPAELLTGPAVDVDPDAVEAEFVVTRHDPGAFDPETARERVGGYVHRPEAVVDGDAELRACGAVLSYAEYTQGGDRLSYVSRISRYDPREYLQLDATAIRSLELFESRGHRSSATLLDVLDETACALGRRLLSRWLRRPLVDRPAIEARHDAVAELRDRALVRERIRDRLTEVYDVERLIGRVSRGRANARDLRSLKATLDVVPDLKAALAEADCDRLRTLRADLDELEDVRELIGRAVQPDPPQEVTEGGVIREGFDDELDELRATEREGREWVADLEASERERTDIDSLEVGYNQVHGYYIEVTNPNLDRVPEDYQRRQTLKNSERFYTPELKRREDEILGAAERADKLEYDLFTEVRADVAAEADRVQSLAEALAALDVFASLATVAGRYGYVRPEFRDDAGTVASDAADGTESAAADVDGGESDSPPAIEIEGGRHPVVERTQESFVPNGASLDRGEVAVVTGPNMSGKSTYMRQVALAVVMAQLGSFVPADAARLPVVDRVFTRVGASDDIAGGQSTFMREMAELTDILHNATEDSLILLDEVGRGTSTADGLAIAWATAEFVHDEVGATTLFATHYHDLTGLADRRERVTNLHFAVDREGDEVTFLHTVEPGASSSSYGVEVARLAGVPDAVVERSRALVEEGVPDVSRAIDAGAATTAADADATAADADATDSAGFDTEDADGTAAVDPPAPRVAADGRDATDRGGATDREGATGDEDTRERPAQKTLTGGYADARTDAARANGESTGSGPPEEALAAVADRLREIDVAGTTPLEALNELNELKRTLDD
jgi:DNA mismatch repair protein MutS